MNRRVIADDADSPFAFDDERGDFRVFDDFDARAADRAVERVHQPPVLHLMIAGDENGSRSRFGDCRLKRGDVVRRQFLERQRRALLP